MITCAHPYCLVDEDSQISVRFKPRLASCLRQFHRFNVELILAHGAHQRGVDDRRDGFHAPVIACGGGGLPRDGIDQNFGVPHRIGAVVPESAIAQIPTQRVVAAEGRRVHQCPGFLLQEIGLVSVRIEVGDKVGQRRMR